jgi:hypothetical protein
MPSPSFRARFGRSGAGDSIGINHAGNRTPTIKAKSQFRARSDVQISGKIEEHLSFREFASISPADAPMIRHPLIARFAICLTVVSSASPLSAATPQQVQQAIDKAENFLLTHRNKDGNWEQIDKPKAGKEAELRTSTEGRQWGGLTALATYALLAGGKDWRSPELTPAIDFLLHANIQGTYALGLDSQLAVFLPQERTREFVNRNVLMLGNGLIMPPPRTPAEKWPPEAGFYGYWTGGPDGADQPRFDPNAAIVGRPQPADWYDRSNSQYAVLGMWALEQAGGRIPDQYWEIVDAAWRRSQAADGAWAYRDDGDVLPSMTAAGIATLFITQDYLLRRDWGKTNGSIRDASIERGLSWMDNHIDEAIKSNFYTLYGIERIGAASGRRFFGATDWYQLGAEFLISRQKEDGSWEGDRGAIPDTCFGLLFLSRGRAPLLMEKLEYQADARNGQADVWNERPRDVANLATWIGRQQESFYNWQVVNLELRPEQLHDAPILYISGSRALNFDSGQKQTLRRFVEQGGLILGNADGGEPAFANTFMKLGRELFPKYAFKEPPPNDLIWREQFAKWQLKPRLMELGNGVRKLMLLIPTVDAGRAWQTLRDPKSKKHDEPLLELGANIFLYATDKRNEITRGDTYLVREDAAIKATRTIRLARLKLGDNPDPEPGGWPRMAAIMHNRFKIDLDVKSVRPSDLAGFKIAHLTGTGALTLSPQEREAVSRFVKTGGTLIVDAAGGDTVFADSAQSELETIFGPGSLKRLPPDSSVYSQKEIPITQIGWRRYALDHVADRKHPQLVAVTLGNRIAVFFSRQDLSAGLVGQNVDGIVGYDPKTAADLMASMLLYPR